jgi:hypothetical protein
MDDPMQASMAADLEVQRRLEDFARGRLTASPASKARSRARVMREARLAFADRAAQAAAASAATDQVAVAHSTTRRTVVRRGGALLAAAALSLVIVGGAFAASTAGGPLYGARVWLETVTLPAGPVDRATAEVARLETRLSEIRAAVLSGDRAAAAAALSAYEQIADEALAGAGTDNAVIETLMAALSRHVAVLQGVAAQVPAQAADSIDLNIELAISHTDAAIDRILAGPNGGSNDGGSNGGAGNGGTNNGGTNNGAGPAVAPTGGSGSSQKPPATPKPKATPLPHPTAVPTPAPTPAPAAATPRPTPKAPPGQASPRPDKTPPAQPGASGQSSESGH